MKAQIVGVILIACLVMLGILATYNYTQDYCSCMDKQPYILTVYNNKCLIRVLDVEDIDIVQALYNAIEECR